tara:strand:- start:225 stop:1016 length:792 start_codon:yes stop_codon:yes gene_type:complete
MVKFKKSLGQNLLIDQNIINKISNLVDIKNKTVLEIGPGTGNLTKNILQKKPKKIFLIEKDKRLCEILNLKLSSFPNYTLFNDDILEFNIDKNLSIDLIFGNLPYNISTQILAKFIKLEKWPPSFSKIVFMFQKEVADRILAKPYTKDFSRITVLSNLRLDIVENFKVSRKCFFPVPKVESEIIVFKPKPKEAFNIKNIENLEKITQIFFSTKRKMINKPFSKIFKNYKDIANLLKIDLDKRPGDLSSNDYFRITEKYEKKIN